MGDLWVITKTKAIMITLTKLFILAILSQTMLPAQNQMAPSVTACVKNLTSNPGTVYVALYNSDASFMSKGIQLAHTEVHHRSCEVVFNEDNKNGKFDTYRCSNNASAFRGPPKWEDAKYEITNQFIKQTITL